MKNTPKSNSYPRQDENKTVRVFARVISYQLSEDELKEVAGGENISCEKTRYPTLDTTCDL